MSPELSCNQPRWGRESWLLVALLVLLVYCECCVALPHVATDLSAVCDCGITIFDAHVVWSWTAVWSAEHRIFINIAITHTMLSLNVTCIQIDR